MDRQRSKGTARKRAKPATHWRMYLLVVALLVSVIGAAGASAQMLRASPSSDAAAAASTASQGANVVGASSGAGASSSVRTLYVYGDQLRPLVEVTGGVQTLNIYGPGGQIIAQVVPDGQGNEEVRYLRADHLGSTRTVQDAEGNAVARFEYGPHGDTTAAGTAAAEARYRYTGHPWDEAQGVYETPARGYDPTLGRFLSVDPQRQGASPYVYAGNNPVGYLDPTGGGEVPFFVQSGFTIANLSTRSKSYKAHAIGREFGLEGKLFQQVFSAEIFDGKPGVPSTAEMLAGRMMLGKSPDTNPRGYNYGERMYFFIGGEENLDAMGGFAAGIKAFRDKVHGFAENVTIINFSEHESRGKRIKGKFEAIGIDPLLVNAELVGEPGFVGAGETYELAGFKLRKRFYVPEHFVEHVHSLEDVHSGRTISHQVATTPSGEGISAGQAHPGPSLEGEGFPRPKRPAIAGSPQQESPLVGQSTSTENWEALIPGIEPGLLDMLTSFNP